MAAQSVFERYEIKYILTGTQRRNLCECMQGIMQIDQYGHATIRNLYLDTDNYRLIRTSLQKPAYKEKVRIRSYHRVGADDPVFVELKKKADGIVYKRRTMMSEKEAMRWFSSGAYLPRTQIEREIEWCRRFYENLKPRVFLSYEREAFCPVSEGDLRITLDSNILAREYDLSLRSSVHGVYLLDRDLSILEVKTGSAMPMWLVRFLNDNRIRKTSFSKYGAYYTDYVAGKKTEENKGGYLYA